MEPTHWSLLLPPEQITRLYEAKDELPKGVAKFLQGKVHTPVPFYILSSMHADCPAPRGFI